MSSTFGSTSTYEITGNNKVKITLNITPEFFEEGIKQAYNKNKQKITLPGFRRGKVPRKLIEAQFGKEFFYEDAINSILPEAYEEAVLNHELEVVSRPEIDVTEIGAQTGAVISCEAYLKPKAQVSSYHGIEYVKTDTQITEDDVNAEIEKDREKNARFVPVTDRETQNGDIVVIDFEGFVDGVPFEGGKGEDFELTLGSATFIPGFEEQLIGKKIDDFVKVYVTFPEGYRAEELAGKPAVFEVIISDIHVKELPEINDDFAQDVSEFETLDEYKNAIRDKLAKEKEDRATQEKEEKIIEGLNANTSVEIPEAMIETEISHMVNNFAQRMKAQGMNIQSFFQYTGMTIERLRESYRKNAEKNVKARLALEAVVEAENLEVSDEETYEDIVRVAKIHNVEPDELKTHMSKNEYKALQMDLKVQKALKIITENAVEVLPTEKSE